MRPFSGLSCAAVALIAGATLTLLAPQAWLVLPTDGIYALVVLLGAGGIGAWPAARLMPRERDPLRRWLLSVGLGLGVLSLTALPLGMLGWFTPTTAWTSVALGGALLLLRIGAAARGAARAEQAKWTPPFTRRALRDALLLAPLGVLLGHALAGACLPPGLLWDAEGFGYDVLEYHLNAPRAYFEAGRITFQEHNVYAAFPQQMELLYWLLMLLRGGPVEGAIPAQLLHVFCGVLAVLAVAAWAPRSTFGVPRGSGTPTDRPDSAFPIALLLAGGAVWVSYVGPLAYVENGLLFFAALAGGILRAQLESSQGDAETGAASAATDRGGLLAAGLCAGLAAGCKYTAIVLVGAALLVAWTCAARSGPRRRLRAAACFAGTAALAFSPWMLRSAVQTGNPVYPFAYAVFGGRAWSTEQDAQWARGHRLPAADSSIGGRVRAGVRELIGSPHASGFHVSWFGPLLWLAAIGGAVCAGVRARGAVFDVVWLLTTLVAWAGLTHMPGRFALPAIVPAAALGARLAQRVGAGGVGLALSAGHATWGAVTLAVLYSAHAGNWQRRTGVTFSQMTGNPEVLVESHPLNRQTPPDAFIWIIGDAATFYVQRRHAYCVVFNRDEWLAQAQQQSAQETVERLRARGVTHVSFSWTEVRRLRSTYGFAAWVTPEWSESLRGAGLRPVSESRGAAGELQSSLFEVPAR